MDLLKSSLPEISSAVKNRQISAVEVLRFFTERIESLDGKLNSFISKNQMALEEAKLIDKKIAAGEKTGPLSGIPFGIKDMICTRGLKTTAGSKILENFIPPYDATLVSKLRSAGAVIVGKLNQDEFAMGSSNETSFFGPTRNPWNLEYVPGGSSGGSAAAQSARLVAASIGTDTGGSIRQPASFCGVVGVKPTYGRISRYGIIAYASSLDQAGPMTNSVEDAALVLETLCGHDQRDSTTSARAVPNFSSDLTANVKGVKIGLLKEFMIDGLSPEVKTAVENSIQKLRDQGAEIIEISVPLTEYSVPMYYLIAASEASSNLSRYDGVKYGFRADVEGAQLKSLDEFYSRTRGEGFGIEVQRRILMGTYCLSTGYYDAYYNKACQVRRLLKEQYQEAFKKCDVILSAVASAPAFKIGSRIADPLAMYLNDIFTTSTNLAGLPGMSVPFALSKERLPIGIQLTAGYFNEQAMLNVGLALQESANLKSEVPSVY